MTYPIEVIRSAWNRISPPEPFPSLESQMAYWRAKEKEQDDLAMTITKPKQSMRPPPDTDPEYHCYEGERLNYADANGVMRVKTGSGKLIREYPTNKYVVTFRGGMYTILQELDPEGR